MKNKFIIISVLILVSLTLSGCGDKNAKQDKGSGEQNQKKEQEKQQSFSGTVKDLLKKGNALECSFSHSGEMGKMKGRAYVDGDRVRQNISFEQNGQEMETDIIIKGKEVYTWNSMQPGQGVKMDLSDIETDTQDSEEPEETKVPQEIEESFKYDCSAWSADSSKFELPQGVEFMDMTEMLKGFQEMGENMGEDSNNSDSSSGQMDLDNLNQQACEACSMSPNPEECRSNLGCE